MSTVIDFNFPCSMLSLNNAQILGGIVTVEIITENMSATAEGKLFPDFCLYAGVKTGVKVIPH